jgi:hypothetical protein
VSSASSPPAPFWPTQRTLLQLDQQHRHPLRSHQRRCARSGPRHRCRQPHRREVPPGWPQFRRQPAWLIPGAWRMPPLRAPRACACGWWATGRGREAAVGCLVPAANGGMLRALAHRRRSIANPRNHGSPALQYWRTIWQSALVRARYGDDRCSRPPRATCFSTAASAAGSPGLVNPCCWLAAAPDFVHYELRR